MVRDLDSDKDQGDEELGEDEGDEGSSEDVPSTAARKERELKPRGRAAEILGSAA